MKRASVIVVAMLGPLGGSAVAADMPTPYFKAPPLPVVPVYTWTGVYVGGNVGYGWSDPRTTVGGTWTTIAFADLGGIPSTLLFADSNRTSLKGVNGGGQLGYIYQINSRWLIGVEADLQAAHQRGNNAFGDTASGSNCVLAVFPPLACAISAPVSLMAATATEARINWFETLRARAGFLATDRFLVYATGGLAYGRVEMSGTSAPTGTFTNLVAGTTVAPPIPGTFAVAKTNLGYSVGGGVEGQLAPFPSRWTWKLEYLHLDLGSLNANVTSGSGGLFTATASTTVRTHFLVDILRVGLNYKFAG